MKRPTPLSSIVVGGCLAVSVLQVSASELNGTIKGSVDGHRIDVKAACFPDNKPWDWLRALSDPVHRPESLRDLNGDGIAIVADTSRSMGRATFSIKVGETFYKFSGGKRSTTFDDSGFRVVGQFDRTEGEGKDRKVVSTYQADLAVACRGI
jgi:hypothetical protein